MKTYDIIVIGGGAAGLMAAGRAAELGASVLLLEKNKQLGTKLLMSGGGRCNFTNNSPVRDLVNSYGKNGSFLFSGLSVFGPEEVMAFFAHYGVACKVEDRGRVLPQDNKADSILQALLQYNKAGKVEILKGVALKDLTAKSGRVTKVTLEDDREFKAKKYIIACGGKSYPGSGSSGEIYQILENLGHTIVETNPGLSQIITVSKTKDLEGLSVSGGELKLYRDGKLITKELGDFIFTAQGLSGPAALSLSRAITKYPEKSLEIRVDFLPQEKQLEMRLLNLINYNKQSDIKNIIAKLCPKRLAEFILDNPNKKANGVTKEERMAMITKLKEYSLKVSTVGNFSEAMVTVGGLDLREVYPKTMQSKLLNNLYIAGEVLDLDGPTGGYNLQVAWTTGYLAGDSAAKQ